VQYEKEFHKIRIFALYEDPGGGGAFTAGTIANSERKNRFQAVLRIREWDVYPGFFKNPKIASKPLRNMIRLFIPGLDPGSGS
jgi:hypothetical protein